MLFGNLVAYMHAADTRHTVNGITGLKVEKNKLKSLQSYKIMHQSIA
jgi:hypothetical protein